ncbi:hypothetical protein AGRA3207_001574 [Actinomadura graeca]|uniref:NACHT domain-containing protein n=1 Tax=Actinomadura graeca TaxID=2750812 RepID=A0ABX8QS46_9ACTN|nr:hypothetical protein [Actinomadura graeca]QXJ20799.1 hypothetical protein AGRA3207_001574 [Actinomadura graeca]
MLVPARFLVGQPSLTDAIAAAVASELTPVTRLDPDLFALPPTDGARWLVLVDGVDEVPDISARRRVLRTIAGFMRDGDADHYRFVVATRHPAAGELDVFGSAVPRYTLLPFNDEEITELAAGWFGVPDADDTAARFTGLLRRTGYIDLARVPLIAVMLCLLYQAHGELPRGRRSDVYEEFIRHLRTRATERYDTTEQAEEALKRWGGTTVERGRRTMDHLPSLIERFAAQRREGETSLSPVDFLAGQPEAECPSEDLELRDHAWRRFLEEALLRSGLLTRRPGGLEFPHWTVLEYLAARHRTRDAEACSAELRRLIDRRWTKAPGVFFRHRTWSMSRHATDPLIALWRGIPAPIDRTDMSYAGFVLDAARRRDPEGTDRRLLEVAQRGGVEGGTFVALQARSGTAVPDEISTAALSTLVAVATSPPTRAVTGCERVLAADTLLRIDDERGVTALEDIAKDPDIIDVVDPWNLRSHHLQSLLFALIPLILYWPQLAVLSLPLIFFGPFDHVRARSISRRETIAALGALFRNPVFRSEARVQAARALSAFGDRRGYRSMASSLAKLAEDSTLDAVGRARLLKESSELEQESLAPHRHR